MDLTVYHLKFWVNWHAANITKNLFLAFIDSMFYFTHISLWVKKKIKKIKYNLNKNINFNFYNYSSSANCLQFLPATD